MNRGIKRIAFILAFVFFTETVLADTNMENLFDFAAEEMQSDNTFEFDNEHIEEAIETTSEEIVIPDEAISEGSIIADIIEDISDLADSKPKDAVISEAAIDYEIDNSELPPEAEALLDEYYIDLEDSDKFLLNTYLLVREDTMEICCNDGYTVRESIPYALIMQIMETDLGSAKNMISAFGSQKSAYDAAYDCSCRMYDYACFSDENVRNMFKEYVLKGYVFDKIMNAYAVSVYFNRELSEVISEEIAYEYNETAEFAEKYCININTAEEILSEYTAEEFETKLAEVYDFLKNGSNEISTIANDYEEPEAGDIQDALNKGPLSYKEGTGASVDPSTGALSYVENICSIPGIAGLDLNINLLYSSLSPIQGLTNNHDFDMAFNWRYSFPAAVNDKGLYMRSGKMPRYMLLPSGEICELVAVSGKEYMPKICHGEEFVFYDDIEHKGGSESFYYIEYTGGNTDYLDEQGHWIKTTDRFGNKIEVTQRTKSVMKICDSTGNTVTIANDDIAKQTVTRPDGSQVVIYFDIYENRITKIVQPGDLATEFTYGAESKDNFYSAFITKIKKPSGLEHNFVYDYVIRPKMVATEVIYRYETEGEIIDVPRYVYSREESRYKYGRISEEYMVSDGKECNKKTYSYVNNYMEMEFANIVDCDCYIQHKHYYDGIAWRCVMGCNYVCHGPEVSVVDPNVTYTYSTKVTNDKGISIKYTYNAQNLNTSIEEYSGSQLISKTEMKYPRDCPLNIPFSVTYTEGDFKRIDAYMYSKYGDVTEHKVLDGSNKLYSQENYEYDYDHYGTLIKTTAKMNDTEQIVQTNTLDSYGKTVQESVVTRNGNTEAKTSYSYDSYGRINFLSQFTDEYNKIVTEYTYFRNSDPNPQYITVNDTEGKMSYNYDELGRVTKKTNRAGTDTYCYYNTAGDLAHVSYVYSMNRIDEYLDYDYAKNTITHTDGENRKTVYDFDPVGNLESITKNGVVQESYTYDNFMRVASHKQGKAVTYYTYDNRDRLTDETIKEGSKILSQKKYSYAYTADGLKTTESIIGDSVSKTITNITQKDIMDRDKMTNNAGDITYYTYDMASNPIRTQNFIVNSNGKDIFLTNEYTYDGKGNVLSTVRTDEMYPDNPKKTYATYDLMGRMITSTDGKGNITTYQYDNYGNLTMKNVPYNLRGYGSDGQPYYDLYMICYRYDNNNNLTNEYYSNQGTRSINYEYDFMDRLVYSANGSEREYYRYDKAGNMTERSSDELFTKKDTYEYDSMNRLVKYTDKLGNSEKYEYDNYNDMIKKTDRNGDVTTYTYDGLHRKLTEKGKGFSNSFTYGATGSIIEEKNDNATVNYTYNAQGLTESEQTKLGSDVFRIDRQYDTKGNLNQDDYYKNNAVYEKRKYTYDSMSRITCVQKAVNSSNTFNTLVKYNYDENDNVSSAYYGNNTYNVYNYNCADMVTAIYLYHKTDNRCIESLEYTYNGDAYISSKKEKYGSCTSETEYYYDISGRLTEEDVVYNSEKFSLRYRYDNRGNRTSIEKNEYGSSFKTNYKYDDNNRLILCSENSYTKSYTYDNNGNQISVEQYRKSDDDVFRLNIENITYSGKIGNVENFEYNGLNQLVGYEDLSGTHKNICGYTAEYKYMPNGYRLSKDVNGETTKFLWDGDNIAAELNSANVITKSYYRGINLISDSSNYYYTSDVNGSILEEMDSDGYLETFRLYSAFGNDDYYYDNDSVDKWGYCGQYYDYETSNYYMRARYYNPNTGRFITEDPIKDGYNWYAYCGNNPVMYFDPSGNSRENLNFNRNIWSIKSDNYGMSILYHYLYGNGKEYVSETKDWGNYMMSNKGNKEQGISPLKDQVKNVVFPLGNTMKNNTSINVDITTSMELENGESIIGYQYLHGTNADVGGFKIQGKILKDQEGNITYDLKYTWNDVIDPNFEYISDIEKSEFAKKIPFANPKDYIIRITWTDKTIIKSMPSLLNRNSGWLA